MNDKLEIIEKMAEMEEEYAVEVDKDVTGLGNTAITELMKSVAFDSHKHAGLYRAIATILKGPLGITTQEYDRLEEKLKKHIEVEKKMIEKSKTLLKDEKDTRVKRLLEEIHADEIRHHVFLSNLLEAVIKKDVIFEDEIWNQIWRDVPTHGAPRDPYA